MKGRTLRLTLLVLLASGCRAPGTSHAPGIQPPARHAFTDVSLIAMDGEGVRTHVTVLVEDGRVSAIGPTDDVRIPAGTIRIDGRGKYLMPGLGDAHAHLSTPGGDSALADRALALFALHGVTMVRSMYTEPGHLRARARVEGGLADGPRVVIVSPALHGGNARTAAAARDSVRAFHAAGYRQVKILPGIPRTVFVVLAEEARRLDLPLVGHVPTTVGLEAALRSGYSSIEHLDGVLDAMRSPDAAAEGAGFFGLAYLDALDLARLPTIAAMVRGARVAIVPTEVSMETYADADSAGAWARRSPMRYVPDQLLARWQREKSAFAREQGITQERALRFRAVRRRVIAALHGAGVPIALGSDGFSLFTVPGASTLDELDVLVAAGLTPYAALRAATVEVAELLHLDGVRGTVTVGSAADLLLLDADPLQDIANVRRQAGVMLRGRWLGRDAIAARLEALALRD